MIYSGDMHPISGYCFQIQPLPTSEHKDLRIPLPPCLHTSLLEDMKDRVLDIQNTLGTRYIYNVLIWISIKKRW
jgi:hypothetical protein